MRIRTLLAVIAAGALLAGCSVGGGKAVLTERAPVALKDAVTQTSPSAGEESSRAGAAQPADGAGGTSATATTGSNAAGELANLPQQRMVIKTATLAVRVRDVPAAFTRAVQLAEAGGGYVQSSTQSEEEGDRADLTIRVPPNAFLPLLASLGALGTVTTKTVSGEDVTQEYYDLGAELDNQMEVRGRLLQLLKQAVKVQDAISVEEQLERVGANLNRIKGRMKYLETMSSLCTVNVSLYGEEHAAAAEGFLNWSLVGHGFWTAAQILVNVFFVLLQVLLVAIPLAAAGGAGTWGVVRLVREVRRRRSSRGGGQTRPRR